MCILLYRRFDFIKLRVYDMVSKISLPSLTTHEQHLDISKSMLNAIGYYTPYFIR